MGTSFLTNEARIYNGANMASYNWCWENWTAICKRMKLEYFLKPYTKINSKQIKDLNVRSNTIRLLEEYTGKTLFDVNQSNLFEQHPRVMKIKTKINK